MTRIARTEMLFSSDDLRVERREIVLDDGGTIQREVLVKSDLTTALVITDGEKVILQQRLHDGNNCFIFGIPCVIGTTESVLTPSWIAKEFGVEVLETRVLLRAYEDATIILGREIQLLYVKVRTLREKGITLDVACLSMRQAIQTVTSNLVSDSLSVLALLLSLNGDYEPANQQVVPTRRPDPTIEDERIDYAGRLFSVCQRSIRLEDGSASEIRFIRRSDTVLVAPIEGDQALLIREYFVGVDGSPLGLVGGRVERASALDEGALESAAQRELREEVGLRGRLVHLLSCHGSNDLTRIVHHFKATDLVLDPLNTGDEESPPVQVRMPVSRLVAPAFLSSLLVSEACTVLLAARNTAQDSEPA